MHGDAFRVRGEGEKKVQSGERSEERRRPCDASEDAGRLLLSGLVCSRGGEVLSK